MKSIYITDCVEAGKVIGLSLDYMIHATPATESKILERVDEYGDSYFEDVSIELLEKVNILLILVVVSTSRRYVS